jgi:hypothetical protein
MAVAFNINNMEVVEFANKLEKIHKSALPVAVRQTLNDVAFQAKKDVKVTFSDSFTERKKNFISSHTVVNKSQNTFNIDQMSSEMGVRKGKSNAGDELSFQELGGTISDKAAIPTANVRIGGNDNKLVSKRFYLENLKGKGIIFKNKRRRIYASDNSIIENIKGAPRFNVLYRFRGSRKYEQNKFIQPAGEMAARHTERLFQKRAEARIKRVLR